MMRRLAMILVGLSARELALLAVLALAGLPALAVFALVMPLANARAEAEAEVTSAAALSAWVAARAEDLGRIAGQGAPAVSVQGPPIGISGVEQSLAAAGLRDSVTRLSNRQDGQVDLGFEVVRFSLVTEWLQRVEPGWGYRIAAFRIEAGEAGDLVEAEFTLRPGGGP